MGGLNDNPSLTPFTYTGTGARALAPELQAKFNAFYQQYCLQAAINADAGQYNFPGFDLGPIEIEVSNGGCVVDQGSYCPAMTFPKKKETSYSASVGGTARTVFNKQ